MKKSFPKIMMCSSDGHGCGYHRIMQPAKFLMDHYENVEFAIGFPPGDPRLEAADIIWLQRANHESFLEWIPFMQAHGKKIIYDIDDLMWEIPSSNLAHRHYPKKELDKLTACLKACDIVTTSTVPLKEFIESKFQKEAVVIRNTLHTVPDFEKPKNDIIKVGWAGSYTHNGDFDSKLVFYIVDLVKKGKIEFHTFGFCPQYFKGVAKHTEWVEAVDFQLTLQGLNLDIGLIVADDNHFNKCKSNIKFLEYSLAKTASIAHNVYPYYTTIEEGVDGLLVRNPKTDWRDHLDFLINDEKARLEMIDKANKKVIADYTYENYGARQLENYEYVFKQIGII